MDDDIRMAGIEKRNGQTYIVFYRVRRASQAVQYLVKWAQNPQLDFNWYDAQVLAEVIRSGVQKHGRECKLNGNKTRFE